MTSDFVVYSISEDDMKSWTNLIILDDFSATFRCS